MATGILSVGAPQHGITSLSLALLVVAIAAYLALTTVQVARLRRDREGVRSELRSPATAFGALAAVAATEVVASRLASAGWTGAAAVVGAAGAVGAVVLLPAAAAAALRASPRERAASATGSWLLAPVALESIAVVASDVGKAWHLAALAVVAGLLWLAGLGAYPPIALVLSRRLATEGIDRRLLAGDHWIVMGALAIAAVGAANFAAACASTPSLAGWAGGLRWASMALWLLCCPIALALGAVEGWLAVRGDLVVFRRERWATVFPLGMYAVAAELAGAGVGWSGVRSLGGFAFWVAIAAWVAVAAGALRRAASGAGSSVAGEAPRPAAAQCRSQRPTSRPAPSPPARGRRARSGKS
jgi:tellurite resistance protein TehA-like permease